MQRAAGCSCLYLAVPAPVQCPTNGSISTFPKHVSFVPYLPLPIMTYSHVKGLRRVVLECRGQTGLCEMGIYGEMKSSFGWPTSRSRTLLSQPLGPLGPLGAVRTQKGHGDLATQPGAPGW